MEDGLEYRSVRPEARLAAAVDSYWMLHNQSGRAKQVVGLPDGRIDLFFTRSGSGQFKVILIGIATQPDEATIEPGTLMFAISFRLPAVEYILHCSIADLANSARELPADFWNFGPEILTDFDTFCIQANQKIIAALSHDMDLRKQALFEMIYAAQGSMSVKALSEKSFWSARQINRYFNSQFGVSLKAYCNILRFRASLEHIARGRLFPELDFADQNHFIKEVKRFSGAVPKELFRNHNDRFILLSAIRQQ